MGSEKTYEGLKVLVGEICEVFGSSPYFHIGADECALGGVGNSEEEKAFIAKHGLKGRRGLYNHYIKRMNDIVKSYGKQTICWEGFHGGGGGGVEIPRDIVVMPFESTYNPANNLVRHGFTVINTAWKPLYVVNNRKWPAQYIYENWNMWLWEHHVNKKCHIQLKRTDPVIGAQMCAWEQPAFRALPSTRERIHAMAERIWSPDAGRAWEDFAARAKGTDALLDRMLGSVSIRAEGLTGEKEREFHRFRDPVTIHMSASPIGTIRYLIDAHDERGKSKTKEPTSDSPRYDRPFRIGAGDTRRERIWWNSRIKRHTARADIVVIKARLFGADGKPLGDVTSRAFYMHGEAESGRF
jgi:N-acetyl-beta-hexosaminidase